jgi:hypothetical protein
MEGQVGADAEDPVVERCMVDLAHAQSIGHDRLTVGLAVLDDVGSIQELRVAEPAHRAPSVVREENLTAEHALVEPSLRDALHVAARVIVHDGTRSDEALSLVQRERESRFAGSSPTTQTG